MRLTSTCSLPPNRKRGKATTRHSPPGRRQENGEAQAAGPFVLAVDLGRKPADALRAASFMLAISGEIDVERIVEEWGQGRFLTTIPRSSRKVWGRFAQVFVDRSRRLIPYWEDQALACRALREIYPPEGYSEVMMPEGRFQPSWMVLGREVVDYQPPPPGSTVVALSDLGVLDQRGSALSERWIERGRWLRDLELKPLALVPYRRAVCPQELSRYWTIIPWETSAPTPTLPRSRRRKPRHSSSRSSRCCRSP